MISMFVVTLSEIIGLTLFGLIFVGWLLYSIKQWVVQTLCKHDQGVMETSACEAICRKCGKNLGFIGTWREKQREEGL